MVFIYEENKSDFLALFLYKPTRMFIFFRFHTFHAYA